MSIVSEHASDQEDACAIIAQLLPGVDAERVVRALRLERKEERNTDDPFRVLEPGDMADARELQRVRNLIAAGTSSRSLQHGFNNPLTALLAEVQLLDLGELSMDQRASISRILDLTRRLVTLSRRMSALESSGRVG